MGSVKTLIQGEYKNGRILLKEKVRLKEGTKVTVIPETKNSVNLMDILLQQKVVKKIWDAPEEDLYGEV